MPFSLFLALKYLKPKRSVTSVITCVSVLGVMLGVAVVIIVRAVMTGFGDLWEQKILDFKPHVTLKSQGSPPVIRNEAALAEAITNIPGVTLASPEIHTPVMFQTRWATKAALLMGVDPERMRDAYKIGEPYAGSFSFEDNSPGFSHDLIVLGLDLALSLGVRVGDDVKIFVPSSPLSTDGSPDVPTPSLRRVSGIFKTGRYDFDSHFAICSLPDAQDLMGLRRGVFTVNIKTEEPANPPVFEKVYEQIAQTAAKWNCRAVTWREADQEIFNALAVEKNMTALLLMLITVVALFCVMNTLLVLTVQKTSEVGLLKALGFSKLKIMGVFVVHGLVQVTVGTMLGLAAAYAVLRNLQNLVEQLAHFGVQVFPKAVYGLDAIPYRLVAADVIWVVVIVYVFGLLASLIPAFLAASKNPVEALKG